MALLGFHGWEILHKASDPDPMGTRWNDAMPLYTSLHSRAGIGLDDAWIEQFGNVPRTGRCHLSLGVDGYYWGNGMAVKSRSGNVHWTHVGFRMGGNWNQGVRYEARSVLYLRHNKQGGTGMMGLLAAEVGSSASKFRFSYYDYRDSDATYWGRGATSVEFSPGTWYWVAIRQQTGGPFQIWVDDVQRLTGVAGTTLFPNTVGFENKLIKTVKGGGSSSAGFELDDLIITDETDEFEGDPFNGRLNKEYGIRAVAPNAEGDYDDWAGDPFVAGKWKNWDALRTKYALENEHETGHGTLIQPITDRTTINANGKQSAYCTDLLAGQPRAVQVWSTPHRRQILKVDGETALGQALGDACMFGGVSRWTRTPDSNPWTLSRFNAMQIGVERAAGDGAVTAEEVYAEVVGENLAFQDSEVTEYALGPHMSMVGIGPRS